VFSNNHVVHWELVKQGVGIGVMVEEIALKERKVKCVLPDLPSYVSDLWLVTHGELRTNRRVRVVFDYLVEKLGRAD
jgi:DNA-binding transcriptional LysR family regulator